MLLFGSLSLYCLEAPSVARYRLASAIRFIVSATYTLTGLPQTSTSAVLDLRIVIICGGGLLKGATSRGGEEGGESTTILLVGINFADTDGRVDTGRLL